VRGGIAAIRFAVIATKPTKIRAPLPENIYLWHPTHP
jgi:hypothetical protein